MAAKKIAPHNWLEESGLQKPKSTTLNDINTLSTKVLIVSL